MKRIIRPRTRDLIVQTWQSQANLSLFLLLLVVTVFVLPALPLKRSHFVFLSTIVYSLVLASGVAVGWGTRLFRAAVFVAVPAVVVRWVDWAAPGEWISILGEALSLLAVLVIGFVLLAQVFREGPINVMRVQGAVAVYLLLGVAYAYGFQIDSRVNPAAIVATGDKVTSFMDWMYFSFCTLSTLGYGDIVPTSRLSRSLAIGEAISGQLYLAILIARLVAMEVGESGRNNSA